jgi:uncharacterized protein (TIGR01777 family)
MRIVVAGGSGFLGRGLVQSLLAAGDEVVLLTRRPRRIAEAAGLSAVSWDGTSQGSWTALIDGAGAVVNLAGEPVAARRWSRKQKERILSSRIRSTRAIVEAVRHAARRPALLVSASAVGYYGTVGGKNVTEDSPPGSGFLPEVCAAWESEASRVEELGVRAVIPRIGIVLGEGGGALDRMLLPYRLFLGGPLGSGSQWFPWVHRDDVVESIRFAIKQENLRGPFNVAAPEPHTMAGFCLTLGRVLHRPSWLPVPSLALRLLLGEMAVVVLGGQKVVPARLLSLGYQFRFGRLQDALGDILRRAA